MFYISHRGNLHGKNPELENRPDHIRQVLQTYDCEIDVWLVDDCFYLGHDAPSYPIETSFLEMPGLWCHAKNRAALDRLLDMNIHCFWHQTDEVTLTSRNYVWTYPGLPLTSRSIALLFKEPEYYSNIPEVKGICSDHIAKYLAKSSGVPNPDILGMG